MCPFCLQLPVLGGAGAAGQAEEQMEQDRQGRGEQQDGQPDKEQVSNRHRFTGLMTCSWC